MLQKVLLLFDKGTKGYSHLLIIQLKVSLSKT